jgi:signal transduction histidine kinase
MLVFGAVLEERRRLQGALAAERNQLRELNEALERRVAERTEQVRALSASLLLAEQQERERLSESLHDDLQQLLYANLLRLRLVRERLAVTGDQAMAAVAAELEAVGGLVRQTIELTRALVAELDPPIGGGGGEGLADAVGALAERMRQDHGLQVDILVTGPAPALGHDAERLLLRIVRELLFNVVKHAGTHHAELRLGHEDGAVRIEIADDGNGFDPSSLAWPAVGRRSYGLHRIRERLSLVDGDLSLDARPGGGTRVAVRLPFTDPPERPSAGD